MKLRTRQRQLKERLRTLYLYRLFGDHLFHRHLWAHDRRSIAGGLALGLFIAFTPTIPLQMLLATFGALFFRLNLPVALAACWVTNPLTVVPIYVSSYKLGRWILEEAIVVEYLYDLFSQDNRIGSIVGQSAYLFTGAFVLGSAAAITGYLGVYLLWTFLSKAIAVAFSDHE